jgi:hypothetical protein
VWAVRCFHKEVNDLQSRYDQISTFLKDQPFDFFIPFKYLSEGINVHGKRYPIVKMAWAQGQTLDAYVNEHYQDRRRMGRLHEDFRKVVHELGRKSVGHGDLSHGNILADQNGIKLIDYDGMFVPGMITQASNELGHDNFQHPSRDSNSCDHSRSDSRAGTMEAILDERELAFRSVRFSLSG